MSILNKSENLSSFQEGFHFELSKLPVNVTLESISNNFLHSSINFNNLITSLIVIISFYCLSKLLPIIRRFRKLKDLPQKSSHWLFGHLNGLLPPPFTSSNQFGKDLKKCVDKLEPFLHDNGLMVFWFSWFPIVFVTDHNILIKLTSATIPKGPGPDVARHFFGDGLVMQDYRKWKDRRKLLAPGYHVSALSTYMPKISKVARNRVKVLGQNLNNDPVDTRKFTQGMSMDITCEITLGIETGTGKSLGQQYRESIDVAIEMMLIKAINPLYWIDSIFRWTEDGKRSKLAAEYIRSFPNSLITSKKLTHIPGSINPKVYDPSVSFSLLDCLVDLHLQSELGKKSIDFTSKAVLEETNSALFAGNETTAGSMAWTMFHLAANPDIQAKVYDELTLNGCVGPEKIEYTEESLKSLKYLECCVKEGLRLCPPIHSTSRRLDEDLVTDDGKILPKGLVIALPIYYVHRDPQYWSEPLKYIPERFEPEASANRPSLAYIPFGLGQRQCLGQKLAMREIKVALAEVLRQYQLVECEHFNNIETAFLGTYRSVESLKIKFIRRKQEPFN